MSLVRSSERNGANGVGFLRDRRRLNVAVTRARRQCAVICDSDTVSQNQFLKGLVTWIESKGEYLSAMEYDQNVVQSNPSIPKIDEFQSKFNKLGIGASHLEESGSATGKSYQNIDMQSKHETKSKRTESIIEVKQTNVENGKNTTVETATSKDYKIIDTLNTSSTVLDVNMMHVENTLSGERPSTIETPEAKADSNVASLKTNCKPVNNFNSVLGNLAKERQSRQLQSQMKSETQSTQPAQTTQPKSQQQKKKPKGNKKLGNSKHKQTTKKNEDDLTGLDDMAFLDAQIDMVQNSHGRKVEGSGKGYRTIVNGILIAKPMQHEKKRETKTSGVLSAKIKQAQSDRRAKQKSKK